MAEDLRRTLAELVKLNASQAPLPAPGQTFNMARNLLNYSTAGVKPYKPAVSETTAPMEDPRGPSPVSRVIDVLSRPLYGVANVIKEELEEGQPGIDVQRGIEAFGAGITGKAKTTGADILEATGAGPEGGFGRAVAGFGLDVALDPLTYAGIGLAGRIGQAGRKSVGALREVQTGTEEATKSLMDDLSRLAAEDITPPVMEARVAPVADSPSTELAIRPQEAMAPPTINATRTEAIEDALKQADLKLETPDRVSEKLVDDLAEKYRAGVTPAQEAIETVPLRDLGPINLSRARTRAAWASAEGFSRVGKRSALQEYGPLDQRNLYNSILNYTNKYAPPKAKSSVTFNMLRAAEEYLENALGKRLIDADGNPFKLSQLLGEHGGSRAIPRANKIIDDWVKKTPSQPVENVKAASTAEEVVETLDPVMKAATEVAAPVASSMGSLAKAQGFTREFQQEATKLLEEAGAVKSNVEASKQWLKQLFEVDTDPASNAIRELAKRRLADIVAGKASADVIDKTNKGVYKLLGANPKILGATIGGSKAVESVMTRMATWWGAKDLRPWAREHVDTASTFTSWFKDTLNPLFRGTTPEMRQSSWRIAQGAATGGTPKDIARADRIRESFEKMLSSEGVQTRDLAGNSAVTRSGVTRKQLNKELKEMGSPLQFTNKSGIDKYGREFDYTEEKWLNSWQGWDVEEPAQAMYQTFNALQRATRKNAMWDDAAARWGSPVKTGSFNTKVKDIERLEGFYFPKEIADQLNATAAQLTRDKLKAATGGLRIYDEALRMWKSGVTIYSPSHHIRNLIGDIYLNLTAGVIGTRPYRIATKVLHSQRSKYNDMLSVQDIADPAYVRSAMSMPGDIALTTKGGQQITNEQFYIAAQNQGFMLKVAQLEDLPQAGMRQIRPFGGRVGRTAHNVSEMRDHWVRLAHFADAVKKSKSKNLDDVFSEAGRQVRKWHPDGSDLTGMERSVMRRLIPFYSWLRKSTPLVLESMVTRPHITTLYPKGMYAVQQAMGIETEAPSEPFPSDQLFPDWIKEKGIGPILSPGMALANIGRQATKRGPAEGYTIINPSNPFLDQIAETTRPTEAAVSGLTPFARVPGEIMFDQTSLGIPLENIQVGPLEGVPAHLLSQIPAAGIAGRVTGQTRSEEPFHPEQLINWLTAAGVRGTGPYRLSSGFDVREFLRSMEP